MRVAASCAEAPLACTAARMWSSQAERWAWPIGKRKWRMRGGAAREVEMTVPGTVHRVWVDLPRPLAQDPQRGHNRWHPSIPPIVRAAPGDRVILQTRDALDGQVTANSTVQDV